ncbi:MAG TPA: glycosidase [Smithellaceae bacterium]|nr:glycosidase [Smithellaceae bacterium]HRS88651.1 glycosidase [Smithellaceae bacterium]HRV25931.1 glycosidase [Smithellaceae bacterium]
MKDETAAICLSNVMCSEFLQRHPENPILKKTDWPYMVNSVFNPGAVRLVDTKEVLLLARVEDRRGISHLCKAVSADGVKNWRIDKSPTLCPEPKMRPEEIWGIEDPRITWIPELNHYAIVYTAYSQGGPGVSLALTKDFSNFQHYGIILSPEDKDAALFPRRFSGRWAVIHRPVSALGAAHIWISFSPDLKHWGDHKILIPARQGGWWDAAKVGLAVPPIETPEGWLVFYHGVRVTAAGSLYRVGIAVLDGDEPTRVLYRSSEWIFGPTREYEQVGDVPDVVFPTGYVLDDDGDTLYIYYGAADSSICLATASVKELLGWLKKHNYLGVV